MVFCTSTITPGRRIDRGKLLHRQDGLEEAAALPAVFLGDLDAHQAHLEELADEVLAEHAGFVHLADVGADLLARELAHGGLEKSFFFGKRSQRRGRLNLSSPHDIELTPRLPWRATAAPAIQPPRDASRSRYRC